MFFRKTHIYLNLTNLVNMFQSKKKEKDKFIVGVVRNPLDVYVSLFGFGCSGKGGMKKQLTEQYNHLYESYKNINNFHNWMYLCMLCNDVGLFTQRFFKLYNKNDFYYLDKINENPLVDYFLINEKLVDGFSFFGINDISCKKLNASKHLPVDDYYNQRLKNEVYKKDKYLFKKFNY
jgi:hypothetical protein